MNFDLVSGFRQLFNKAPEKIFFCPGRVNLIGEHIDYNGGSVMPCAISRGTWLAVSRNAEKVLHFRCINFPETADLKVQSSYTKTGREWFNYPLGVFNELLAEGHPLSGLDLLYYGNLPIGAGLSSSASIEMVTGYAADQLFGLNVSKENLALLCKRVENEFIGVSSGIMDQFAVAKGEAGKAILLNCDTLAHEYLPFDTGEFALVIINSRKERKLSESKYNERFAECGRALRILKQKINAVHLCDIPVAEFEEWKHLLEDAVLRKRTEHVVYEQARVLRAANALRSSDLVEFGRLMYESHESLKNLYEVSGRELDAIVDFCSDFDGCIGARMTGAGFGGCAIALVKKEKIDEFSLALTRSYLNEIGYEPEIFASEAAEGVKEIFLNR